MLPLCSQHPISSKSIDTAMTSSFDHGKAILIAMSLLKSENPQAIQKLKDLLTFFGNSKQVNNILTTTVLRLIYTSPPSALWLFRHPDILAPEVKVREIVAQELTRKILSWGYTLEDFYFTSDSHLEMSKDIQRSLFSKQQDTEDELVLALIRALLI